MICPCGIEDNSTTRTSPYSYVRYNEKGEIIYAVCFHGHIVINKTGKWKDDFKNKGTDTK